MISGSVSGIFPLRGGRGKQESAKGIPKSHISIDFDTSQNCMFYSVIMFSKQLKVYKSKLIMKGKRKFPAVEYVGFMKKVLDGPYHQVLRYILETSKNIVFYLSQNIFKTCVLKKSVTLLSKAFAWTQEISTTFWIDVRGGGIYGIYLKFSIFNFSNFQLHFKT